MIMNSSPETIAELKRLSSLLEEADRRRVTDRRAFLDPTFEHQNRAIADSARLQAWFCTRRAGKSMGAAKRLLMDALETPNCNVLYIALTRFSAKGILWDDCLKTAARNYSVSFNSNETELSMKLGNGSNVYLAGADAKPDEMQKFLGRKYKTVIIDEAASYRIDLRKMVYQILKPATADLGGTIILAGTPGDLTKGLFYDVTTGIEPGWRVHKWSAFDNPYMATQWRAEIEELKAINPGIEDTPIFKQMYLGEWFVDTQKLVYKATRERNLIDALPTGRGQPYYVLGVDLGYDPDPSAFVLSCYFEHDPTLYFIEAWEKKKMLYSDVAERIQYYRNLHANLTIVVDAANKQGIEEMKQRYRLPLIASDKHGKPGFIELMNADLSRGFIKCLPEAESMLTEWASLVWDDTKAARVEHSACANHRSDAALYNWRYSYAYSKKLKQVINKSETQRVEEFWEKEAMRIERKKAIPIWERDYLNE